MKTFIYLTLSLFLFATCGDKKQNEDVQGEEAQLADIREKMYNDVMAVHDEVMPKMDEIYRLKNKLQEELKVLLEDSRNTKESKIEELTRKINELESAGNDMMIWMRQFNTVPDSLGHEAMMKGLEEEMRKIEKVKSKMLEAIERAKEEY